MTTQRPYREISRVTPNGIIRCCKLCKTWKPQDTKHFYRRKSSSNINLPPRWEPVCRDCRTAQVLERWRKRQPAATKPDVPELTWANILRLKKS